MKRPRFSLPEQVRRALQVDGHMAEAEGLAAGTGLLTGDLTRGRAVDAAPCPECSGRGDVAVIDLVAQVVSRRCQRCGHRWDTASEVPATDARSAS